MAKETYIATVQIVVNPNENLDSVGQACDWFSGLLSENEKISDWSYLKMGEQYLYPTKIVVEK